MGKAACLPAMIWETARPTDRQTVREGQRDRQSGREGKGWQTVGETVPPGSCQNCKIEIEMRLLLFLLLLHIHTYTDTRLHPAHGCNSQIHTPACIIRIRTVCTAIVCGCRKDKPKQLM